MLKSYTCNTEIDYSTVIGKKILPYVFTLNTAKSILEPAEGEYQKFCYDIQGVGEDKTIYAELSYFVLEICSNINLEDLINVTVIVDGTSQNVTLGENVEIKTEENPDNATGCVGLKFDFPLTVNGTMEICFSLTRPYSIGPVNVWIYGGVVVASGLSICGPVRGNESCSPVIYQQETVCVPVTVIPYADPGIARAICCGAPIVTPGNECSGEEYACYFTITQNLCIEVPITFGAEIKTGAAVVQCGSLSTTPCECDSSVSYVKPTETQNIMAPSIPNKTCNCKMSKK